MTVKPPGGPAETPPVAPETPESKPATGASFEEILDDVDLSGPVSPDLVKNVVAKMASGEMSPAEASETLLQYALDNPAFKNFSAERIERVRSELREVFESDPNVIALLAQIRL